MGGGMADAFEFGHGMVFLRSFYHGTRRSRSGEEHWVLVEWNGGGRDEKWDAVLNG
jgi:hypothetical protein